MSTVRRNEETLASLQRLPHVLGVAVDADDVVTFLLDENDEVAREHLLAWGASQARGIKIKIIGPIAL